MYIDETKIFVGMIVLAVVAAAIVTYVIRSRMVEYNRYRGMKESFEKEKMRQAERERHLIAADLHDDVSTVLTMSLRRLDEVEPNNSVHIDALRDVKEMIGGVCTRLRNMSQILVPLSVEKKGPFYALEEFSNLYGRAKKLELEVNEVSCQGLSAERSLHLFRILQEIYENAVKHSGGTRMEVNATRRGNRLHIETADDGKGFEMGVFTDKFGFGLQSLAARARLIEAKLYACSLPGQGTRYSIELDIEQTTEP